MKKLLIPVIATAIVAIILGLIATLWAGQDKKIDSKANNETILMYMQKQEAQHRRDCEEEKEYRRIQEKKEDKQYQMNKDLLDSIQMMLIQRADVK